MDHAHILRQQGVTVVRGPAYSTPVPKSASPPSPDMNQHKQADMDSDDPDESQQTPKQKRHPSVPLRVESPSNLGEEYVDSDDGDENVDANLPPGANPLSESKLTKQPLASNANYEKPPHHSRSKRNTGSKSFLMKGKSRKSREKVGKSEVVDESQSKDCDTFPPETDSKKLMQDTKQVPPLKLANSELSFEKLLERHMDNTPCELLAPIVVPRTSIVFGENVMPSSESSQRYADVEGDHSSGVLPFSSVARATSIHKVHHHSSINREDDSVIASGQQGLRSRRKSKPFLSPTSAAAVEAANVASWNSPLAKEVANASSAAPVKLSPIPPPVPLSREPSLGMLSEDDGQDDGASASEDDDIIKPSADLFPVPAPTAQAASQQRIDHHAAALDVPRAAAVLPAIARRSSAAGKRKTVSFHDAAPVIIEPNLRAPSLSVPRSATLAKESLVRGSEPAGPPTIGSVLSQVRDSVTGLATPAVPLVDDDADLEVDDYLMNEQEHHGSRTVPRRGASMQQSSPNITQLNDAPQQCIKAECERSGISVGSSCDASADYVPWGRGSHRVSVRDTNAIREATRRQSMAVAQAMSQQIRGVPRSAMLAYSQNEVIIDHDDEVELGSEDSSARDLWSKRRSRASKSIRVPEFKPGVVPPPPPPPPFSPNRLNVRSVRLPPPPPTSPLRSQRG